MTGEISIGGVFIPSLLLLGLVSLLVVGLLTQLLQVIGAYRYVAYRPLVDLCLYVLVLGLAVLVTASFGPHL